MLYKRIHKISHLSPNWKYKKIPGSWSISVLTEFAGSDFCWWWALLFPHPMVLPLITGQACIAVWVPTCPHSNQMAAEIRGLWQPSLSSRELGISQVGRDWTQSSPEVWRSWMSLDFAMLTSKWFQPNYFQVLLSLVQVSTSVLLWECMCFLNAKKAQAFSLLFWFPIKFAMDTCPTANIDLDGGGVGDVGLEREWWHRPEG